MTKETKKTVPKLRFPGFTYDWEQRKVIDVAPLQRGFDLPTSQMEEGPYPVVMSNGVGGYHSSYKVKGPGVVTGRSGTIGKLHYIEVDYWPHNTSLWVTDFKANYPKFIYYLYQHLDLSTFSSGSGVPTLNRNDVHDAKVFIPVIEEQKRISETLDTIDYLITLHQRKLDQIKEYKKGLLQKMFPKDGEKVPEIRFPGFTGDWEQCQLSEIYQSISNAFVGTASPYYVEDGHFYLESNNVKDGQINYNSQIFINDEFYEKQKDKWLHTGDMVMVQSGHVGHAAVIPEELDNTAAHALIMFKNPKTIIEPYFLNFQYQTEKAKKKIENITTGNTIKHILASDMQEFVVDVTSWEEQAKIAYLFRKLDNLITLHQLKLEKMKEYKKGILQQMFV